MEPEKALAIKAAAHAITCENGRIDAETTRQCR
jgi:hypothetical protein